MAWNYGDVLDAIEPAVDPKSPAFIFGDQVITWAETNKAMNNLAHALVKRGALPGDKIAIYMRNHPAYVQAMGAGFKARMTHVNVNYRYTPEEVLYIFDNSDAQTVVYSAEFRRTIEQIRERLPKVKTWIEVASGAESAPFAERFEDLIAEGDGSQLRMKRSPDDMLFIYTGGTTGMPKGVMWTHDEIQKAMNSGPRKVGPVAESPADLARIIKEAGPQAATVIPAPPLMHGTGLLTAMAAMLGGGCSIILTGTTFSADEMLAAIDAHKPQSLVIVGNSFAKPLLNAMNAAPGKYDVSSVATILSSGVMWSLDVKRGMLEHMPDAVLVDAFSSSESMGLGMSMMTRDAEVQTAKFIIGDRCRVFDENDKPVEPGSGVRGMIAVAPPNPVGYYKDEEKTARTFRVIDGVRYSIAGDWCTVEKDGALTLLGRGSACINTAGEKVFPEEVEEALKTHPSVEDALVVGVPDEKWGQAITGVVRLSPGSALDEQALHAHVRQTLAAYKAPKRVVTGDVLLRAPNGKADYKSALEFAKQALGLPA